MKDVKKEAQSDGTDIAIFGVLEILGGALIYTLSSQIIYSVD